MPKTIKTHSNSVKSIAATSEIGLKSGDGEAPTAGQLSCSRKGSKSKVVGHKSIGSTQRFPPPISKKMGGGSGYNNNHQKTSPFLTAGKLDSHSFAGQLWLGGLW